MKEVKQGLVARGTLRVVKPSSFTGKDGTEVEKVKVYLDEGRAYPLVVEAIGGGAKALREALRAKDGTEVEIPVYMSTKGKYPVLRFAGSAEGGE